MNKMIAISALSIVLAILHGCTAISKLPSFEHCQEVQYSRTGTDVAVNARCTAGVAF